VKACLNNLWSDLVDGSRRWLSALLAFAVLGAAFGFLAYLNHSGFDWSWHHAETLGHITRVYGTVKLEHTGRLEAGQNLLAPFHLGEQIQTGEDSAAEALFFGGSLLELQSGSVARFEDSGENVSIQVLMGKAYFEFPPEAVSGKHFVFKTADGKLAELPSSRRVVVSLNSASRFEDAVEVKSMDPNQDVGSLDEAEMKYMAMEDSEYSGEHPLLVRPIAENGGPNGEGRTPASNPTYDRVKAQPMNPSNDETIDIESKEKIAFSWKPTAGPARDPVVGYEVEVRPAFGYEVEDRARTKRVIPIGEKGVNQLAVDNVGGGGVFLWSVRAITANGNRGPASTPRWLEIKFPKQLAAPELLKPKVE
jgi:hypothetical protein